jgi:hypothetical protein
MSARISSNVRTAQPKVPCRPRLLHSSKMSSLALSSAKAGGGTVTPQLHAAPSPPDAHLPSLAAQPGHASLPSPPPASPTHACGTGPRCRTHGRAHPTTPSSSAAASGPLGVWAHELLGPASQAGAPLPRHLHPRQRPAHEVHAAQVHAVTTVLAAAGLAPRPAAARSGGSAGSSAQGTPSRRPGLPLPGGAPARLA